MYLEADTHWSKANAQNANWTYTFITGVLVSAAYKISNIGPTEMVLG